MDASVMIYDTYSRGQLKTEYQSEIGKPIDSIHFHLDGIVMHTYVLPSQLENTKKTVIKKGGIILAVFQGVGLGYSNVMYDLSKFSENPEAYRETLEQTVLDS